MYFRKKEDFVSDKVFAKSCGIKRGNSDVMEMIVCKQRKVEGFLSSNRLNENEKLSAFLLWFQGKLKSRQIKKKSDPVLKKN